VSFQKGQPITPKYLKYERVMGAGHQIKAFVNQEVPCVEFTMKKDCEQTIMVRCSEPVLMASEPFVQFAPDSWESMIAEVFKQMVEAWNEKHAQHEGKVTM